MSVMVCSTQFTGGYIHFKVSGFVDIDSLRPQLRIALLSCYELKDSRFFIDLWDVQGELAATHKVFGGIVAIEIYSTYFQPHNKSLRVAVLGQKSNAEKPVIPYTPGTDVLRNIGIQVRHTYDRHEAIQWVS